MSSNDLATIEAIYSQAWGQVHEYLYLSTDLRVLVLKYFLISAGVRTCTYTQVLYMYLSTQVL